MSEYILSPCPNCGNPLRIRREYLGKRAACKHCGHVFTLVDPEQASAPARPHQAGGTATWELPTLPEPGSEPDPELVETVRRLKDENHDLRNRLNRAELAVDELARAELRLSETRAAMEALASRHSEAEDGLAASRREVEELTARIEAARRAHEEHVAGLEVKAEALEHEREEARRQWESERATLASDWDSRLADAARGHDEARARLDSLDEAHRTLHDAHAALQARSAEAAESHSAEADRLRAELDALRASSAARPSADEAPPTADVAAGYEREIASLSELVRVGGERADALAREIELEREWARREVEALKFQVAQDQAFKQEMRTFLGGLGIKLPTA